jgi:hypothetical protein
MWHNKCNGQLKHEAVTVKIVPISSPMTENCTEEIRSSLLLEFTMQKSHQAYHPPLEIKLRFFGKLGE